MNEDAVEAAWREHDAVGVRLAEQRVDQPDAATAEVARLRERIDDALIEFQVGFETRQRGLPVDWAALATRMAKALVHER